MMTPACSARNIPGVWPNSMAFAAPFRLRLGTGLGILLACSPMLAQSGPARLGRAVDKFESRRYREAIQELQAVQPQIPLLADYVSFYIASSRVELQDFAQV